MFAEDALAAGDAPAPVSEEEAAPRGRKRVKRSGQGGRSQRGSTRKKSKRAAPKASSEGVPPEAEVPENAADGASEAPQAVEASEAQQASEAAAEGVVAQTSEDGDGAKADPSEAAEAAEAEEASPKKRASKAKGKKKKSKAEAERPVDDPIVRRVAALLFASPEPLTEARLVKLLGGEPAGRVRATLEVLERRLTKSKLPFEVTAVAGGWQLVTAPDTAETVARLAKARHDEKFSPASLETLSVIAYRQPVTKSEIEAIRGVQAGPILRSLVDRGLVKVAGRAEVPGHPLLYATTKKFLETFGLMGLDDLPRDSELVSDS